MQFDKQYKPELVTSKDHHREHLAYVHLDVERKRMAATDGRMLVVVPCTPEPGDHPGPVTAEALKAARKAGHGVSCNGALAVHLGASYPRPKVDVDFPDVDRVLPDKDRDGFRIGLNAKLLASLAQAMGSDTVELRFDGPEDPIVVLPHCRADNDAYGVLMPVRIA